jgi:hypothetical protein
MKVALPEEAQALLTNVRLGRKCFQGTNTLAYLSETPQTKEKKSFTTSIPETDKVSITFGWPQAK